MAPFLPECQVKLFLIHLFLIPIFATLEVALNGPEYWRRMLRNGWRRFYRNSQQIIEIRKYHNCLEFESPGHFPQGIDETNFLRKTNPRNPGIMDVLREINYAEKAGSGFDKIFTALLSKGKKLPQPIQTDNSILLRVEADVYSEKLAELSLLYKQTAKKDIDLEKLIVLNHIYTGQKLTFQQLEQLPFVNHYQLRKILAELQEIEFIEATGRTSGVKYIIHRSKLISDEDKIGYTKYKKQEKARQIEAILRFLDAVDEIDNEGARKLLLLNDSDIYAVSRLFAEMKVNGLIEEIRKDNRKVWYGRKK